MRKRCTEFGSHIKLTVRDGLFDCLDTSCRYLQPHNTHTICSAQFPSTMRSTTLISLLTLSAPLAHAFSTYTPLHRRDICTDNNREVCDDSCMAPGSVCCNEGTGTYCPADTYCTADGCCPTGEICVGGGGTIDVPVFLSTATSEDLFSSDDFFASTTIDSEVSTTDDAFGSSATDDAVFTSEEVSSVEETSLARPTRTAVTETPEPETSLRVSRTTAPPANTEDVPTGTGAAPRSSGGAAAFGVAGLPGLALVAGQLVMAL